VVVSLKEHSPVLLLQALLAGASGCICKPLKHEELLPILNMASSGRAVFCSRADRLLLECLRGLDHKGVELGLSQREREVMLCISIHQNNKTCAAELGISGSTVHAHLHKIYRKLGVEDRQAAIRVFTKKLSAEQ
jgi:DNA-binding NarL/FixJ family response regulator